MTSSNVKDNQSKDRQAKDIVLVVDDSPESLSMINDILDSEGLTVLVALEGQQALTIAKNITPDIILMDALMPNMDGFETCRLIKSNQDLSHIPVIFMTGLSDTESVVKGLNAGGVDYIQKPVNSDELIARMKVHLTNARQTQSAREALDSAGHFLFSVSTSGNLLWATPQTHHLFFEMGITADTLRSTVVDAQLNSSPTQSITSLEIDCQDTVSSNGTKLELHLVRHIQDGEMLMRLVKVENKDEFAILKKSFSLTQREAEVLLWLARGKSNSEIAIILGVSPRTINKHLEQVYRKLNVENRTAAVVTAMNCLESD